MECTAFNVIHVLSLQGLIELYHLKQKHKEFDLDNFFKKVNVSTFYRSFIERGLREVEREMNEEVKGN